MKIGLNTFLDFKHAVLVAWGIYVHSSPVIFLGKENDLEKFNMSRSRLCSSNDHFIRLRMRYNKHNLEGHRSLYFSFPLSFLGGFPFGVGCVIILVQTINKIKNKTKTRHMGLTRHERCS